MRIPHHPDTSLRHYSSSLLSRPVLFGILLLVTSHPASARVYRCTAADGKISYLQTPCPAGQTGAKMHGIGSKMTVDREACARVRDFASQNFNAIRQGSEPARQIDKYGGPGYINSLTLNVINFVSGYRYSADVPAMKVAALAFNKCVNGGFGKQLEVRSLPAEMLPPDKVAPPAEESGPAPLPQPLPPTP